MYILNHIFFVDVGEISSNYRSLRQYTGAIMTIFGYDLSIIAMA
jgi:hypothetical protein